MRSLPQRRHSADLGQRLDEQRPRHNRIAGKVPLEAVGVIGHVVNHAHGTLPVLDLFDAVEEEERLAVGQDGLDRLLV